MLPEKWILTVQNSKKDFIETFKKLKIK